VTGIAEIGSRGGELVRGTLASMELHGLEHEVLSAPEAMRRFPVFTLPPDYLAVLQPDGGFVEVEPSITASLALAAAAGAQIRSNEAVRAIEPRAGFVRIVTERSVVEAEQAVVAAGPWTSSLLPHLPVPLRATRQVAGWFDCADAHLFAADRFPVFMLQSRHGLHYGIPPHGGAGLKIARHHHRDESVDPDEHDRTVGAEDEALIRAIAEHIPGANGRLIAAGTCLYTMTPDGDFVIDRLPGSPQIIVVSACSGHGFKFAPVIGEIVAELVTGGSTRHDISRFRLDRFR
jgi:sarcosine oxidase